MLVNYLNLRRTKSKLAGWSSDVELSEKIAPIESSETSGTLGTSPIPNSGSPSSHSQSLSIKQPNTRRNSGSRAGKNSPSRTGASYDDRLFGDVEEHAIILLESTGKNSEINENITDSPSEGQEKKSKSELRAERRAKQETQRAAKANATEGKTQSTPKHSKTASTSQLQSQSNQNQQQNHQHQQNPQIQIETKKKVVKAHTRADLPKKVSLFNHIPQQEKANKMIAEYRSLNTVHPAVVNLGLQFAEFEINGGNSRALAMLTIFKKVLVISDYETPEGSVLQRHLTSHISKQVDFLANIRALAASMRTAVKFLKTEITNLDHAIPEKDAKELIKERIDAFIRDRIMYAERAIVDFGLEKIKDNDVILTYARSSVVVQLLKKAKNIGKIFKVVIVDSRPKWDGKETLKQLVDANVDCIYVHINAINYVMKDVTKVLLGASAVLSNGTVMSRAGSATIAMCANHNKIPVIVASETYKFSDSVRLDSYTWNEIGDPIELATPETKTAYATSDNLYLLNLHYDLMPSEFVTVILCDAGWIPTT
ncbi:hypothetical protein HK096_004022, partial [Nowakowskiella sp. JEL0078]